MRAELFILRPLSDRLPLPNTAAPRRVAGRKAHARAHFGRRTGRRRARSFDPKT